MTLRSLPSCTAYQTLPSLLSSVHQTCDELFEFKAVTCEDKRKVIMVMPLNKAP